MSVRAWRPEVDGVAEVFHARWHDHAYPVHTHTTWTLLVVDQGIIAYRLGGHDRTAEGAGLTVLPPHVPHDGRAATAAGFRKRVVYLDEHMLAPDLLGHAVDTPFLVDRRLLGLVSRLDLALVGHDGAAADDLLALVLPRLAWHLGGRPEHGPWSGGASVACALRDRVDADPVGCGTVGQAARSMDVSVEHLVRSFSATFGIAPHRYVIGRRLELARAALLEGRPASDVAASTGFYDQAHLTRHFRSFLGTTPARYQRSARAG